jgi:iron complex outermembrane receptor protein
VQEQQTSPPAIQSENDAAGVRPYAANPGHWHVFPSIVLLLLLAVPALSQTTGSESLVGDSQDTDFGESLLFQEIPSVFRASKYEQKVTEAPSSVSIVTAEEIRRYGYRTLADVLRNARGFYTTNDRNFSYAGVRGFGRPADFNSRLLVLVDGFRTNDGVYNAVGIGLDFPIDIDLIERVEIARGPSSSLYGTSAFFGVVNVITKSGRQVSGAQLTGALGSFGTGAGRVDYGERFSNGVDLVLSSTLTDSDGQDLFFPEFADVNGGVAVSADYESSQNVFGKVGVNDFTFQGSYAVRTKGIPTASYETTFNDPGTFTADGSDPPPMVVPIVKRERSSYLAYQRALA